MASSVEAFLQRCPEFENLDTSVISNALTDAAALLDQCEWREFWDLACIWLAAHELKVTEDLAPSPTSTTSPASVNPVFAYSSTLASYREGDLSIAFKSGDGGWSRSTDDAAERDYASTVYGRRYLRLRKRVIVAVGVSY